MKRALAVILAVGLSTSAAAQAQEGRSRDSIPPPTIGLTLPPIGLPLPEIGLPLPPIGLRSIGVRPVTGIVRLTGDTNGLGRSAGRQHSPLGRHGVPSWPTLIYLVPLVGWDSQAATVSSRSGDLERTPPKGYVRLELQRGVVPQLYIDGYFVGTVDEVNDSLPLDAGQHTLELRADGYETLELNVQVFPGRSTTYRGALRAIAQQSVPRQEVPTTEVSPPARPATVYLIPGCYLGNIAPQDVPLPPGCDAARAVTVEN